MTKIVPLFGPKPTAPEGLKTLLSLNQGHENQLFRTAAQARRFFNACVFPTSEYGGGPEAIAIAEDILAHSHAEHQCARTTEKLVHELISIIRNANSEKIHRFRIIDGQGSVFMGYADGSTFTLKIALDYKETLEDGFELFNSIITMDFEISEGQAFLISQSTEK